MKQCYSRTGRGATGKLCSWAKFFTVILFLAIGTMAAYAQGGGNSVSGIVKDEAGNPVIGVTVTVPGTTKGTTTGIDGDYTIKADGKQSLTFSYIGYKSQTIPINNRTKIDVKLIEDNTSLDEVVVVGYGLQKRRDIVGAVESFSAKQLEERIGSSMSISRALQGAIPGLSVSFSDGKPNRGAAIQIRGAKNSIGAGGSALVLVDGVETDMSTVNPDDIENISVLKDASSTAVYGSRGTFGVILMTTKKAQKGSAKVTYTGTYTFYQRATKPEMVTNGFDYTTSFLESYINCMGKDPANINNVFKFDRTWYAELQRRNSDPSFEKWRINNKGVYEYFGNTNWYDVFYRSYTTGHQHNVSVTGGGDIANYYVSGRMFEQDGIYNAGDEKYRQFNVKAKGSVKVKPWLTIENSTDFMYRTSHQPTSHTGLSVTPMTVSRMLNHQAYPVALVTNPDGSWTEAAVYTGWAGFVEGNSWRKDRKFDMTNRTAVNIDFIKNVLVGAVDVSYYFNQTERQSAINSYTFSNAPGATGERPSGSLYEERSYNRNRVSSSATLTYTPQLGDHHALSVMGGWNIENYDYKTNLMNRQGIIIPSQPNFSLLDGEAITLKDNGSWSTGLVGAFFRASYSYKSKYLLEASGRYDGNSKFPANQRWGFFPSGSVGWRISEENFLKGASRWLDNLKVRASIGTSGNGLIGDAYAYLSTMSISKSSVLNNGNVFNYTGAPAPIPDGLTWEKATTYDIGLDFEALNGRLNLTADIYRKNTTDMYVVGPELPAVYGNSAPKGNYADMRTQGWEASISWRDSRIVGGKELSYNVKVAVWDDLSKITRYTAKTNTLPTNYSTAYYEGMTLGELWGYECNGLFQSDEEARTYADYTKFNNNAVVWSAGDPRYVDQDGDHVITNGNNTLGNHGDLIKIGNTLPRYQYSIQAGVRWNGIGLSMVWQGVGKRDWYPAKESGYFWGQYGRSYSMSLPWHSDRWSETNRDAYWPRLVGYSASNAGTILSQPNTRYLQDASYIRLKNLTIDYNFPKTMINKIGLQALKVYFSGENLLTFSPMKKYARNYDPESIFAGDADFGGNSAGTDNSGDGDGYPVMRSFTLGLSLTF